MPDQIAWSDRVTDAGVANTTKRYTYGRRRVDPITGIEYVYMQSSSAFAQFDFAVLDTADANGTTLKQTTTTKQPLFGSPQQASPPQANQEGWFAVRGVGITINVANGVAAGDRLVSSGTGGVGTTADATAIAPRSVTCIVANASGVAAARLCVIA